MLMPNFYYNRHKCCKEDGRKIRKPITDKKFALLTEILNDVKKIEWIAKTHNTTPNMVYKLRKELGISKPHRKNKQ